ncbi:hypothetical protein OAB63_04595 [Alphaproteobacteria bacterium]|nr:hypothetical protein [Alphaproteobacteria bacterium]
MVAGHSASAESASAVAVVPLTSDAPDNEATQDSHVEQDNIIAPEEETTNDIVNPGIGGCDGNNTDAELEAMNAAPDIVRIKCVKRKYYMLHTDDSRWYQYSRKEVNELAGNVVVNGKEYEAGPHAWNMKDSTQRGFELRQGARKKRVGGSVLAQPPSGAPSLPSTPLQTKTLPQCVQICVRLLESEAGPHAWNMKDSTQRGFELRQGARKKRVGGSVLAQPPSGAPSLPSTPLQTKTLPQCVQICVRLLEPTCMVPVHLVSDVPRIVRGFRKPSKWGWEGLDISRLTNCIEKLIQLAQPTDLFILQTHHTDTNTSRHCCCIKERMLCCPSEKKWRPLSLEAFEVLYIDRIIRIYKK